ncbi:MAG TPA: hypothetical protein VFO69_03200, partial [Allosphingosinicella sp.]|nr:hypothetical protein [Allosphingosinicella sp.]
MQRAGQERVVSHRYSVFGLIAASEIPLPELRPFEGQAESDLVIRRGAVQARDAAPGLNVLSLEKALLVIPEVGRYLMREGQEMIVESDPAGSERNLRL